MILSVPILAQVFLETWLQMDTFFAAEDLVSASAASVAYWRLVERILSALPEAVQEAAGARVGEEEPQASARTFSVERET